MERSRSCSFTSAALIHVRAKRFRPGEALVQHWRRDQILRRSLKVTSKVCERTACPTLLLQNTPLEHSRMACLSRAWLDAFTLAPYRIETPCRLRSILKASFTNLP